MGQDYRLTGTVGALPLQSQPVHLLNGFFLVFFPFYGREVIERCLLRLYSMVFPNFITYFNSAYFQLRLDILHFIAVNLPPASQYPLGAGLHGLDRGDQSIPVLVQGLKNVGQVGHPFSKLPGHD